MAGIWVPVLPYILKIVLNHIFIDSKKLNLLDFLVNITAHKQQLVAFCSSSIVSFQNFSFVISYRLSTVAFFAISEKGNAMTRCNAKLGLLYCSRCNQIMRDLFEFRQCASDLQIILNWKATNIMPFLLEKVQIGLQLPI